jgi:hypothetical protein
VAGRDTTASLLSHTLHILARRPDVWSKLKAEIDELKGRAPDYEMLRNMKYLKYVLNECKYILQVQNNTNSRATKDSPSPTPLARCPHQRPFCFEKHHSPPWRWSGWAIPYLHPQGAASRLLCIRDAPTAGHLRPGREGVQA